MKTICVQIGNSDDKLTQKEWSSFVTFVNMEIQKNFAEHVHFFGLSSGAEKWQNASWVFECDEKNINGLKAVLIYWRENFKQDSIAWLEGETKFI